MKKRIALALALCALFSVAALPAQAAVTTPTMVVFGEIDPELMEVINDLNPNMSRGFTGNLVSQVGEAKAKELTKSLGPGFTLDGKGFYNYLATVYGPTYKNSDFWQKLKESDWDFTFGSKNNPYGPSDLEARVPSNTSTKVDLDGRYVRMTEGLYRISGQLMFGVNSNYPDRWVLFLHAVDSATTPASKTLTWGKK